MCTDSPKRRTWHHCFSLIAKFLSQAYALHPLLAVWPLCQSAHGNIERIIGWWSCWWWRKNLIRVCCRAMEASWRHLRFSPRGNFRKASLYISATTGTPYHVIYLLEKVLCYCSLRAPTKWLLLAWKGPFTVLERINYVIGFGTKTTLFHINLLKTYEERPPLTPP